MGNTELRRIENLSLNNVFYASSTGILYRQLKHKPREHQLNRIGSTIINHDGLWLNPIKGFKDAKGYLRVEIDGKNYSIHRLIAKTFIPNLEDKPQINHINGIKSDNKPSNLEWVTNQENIVHAFEVLKRFPSYGGTAKFGEKNNPIRLARNDAIELDIISNRLTYKEIAEKHGVTDKIVKNVARIRKVQRLSKS